MNYDELVKRMRNCTSDTVEDCAGCPYQGGYKGTYCMNGLISEAADAIEELQQTAEHYKGCADDWYKEACDYKALAPKWIPVTERLPEKNQIVVVVQHGKTWDYGQFRGLAYLGGNIHKWNWKNNTTKTVDYWMPKKSALPEPPKEETE